MIGTKYCLVTVTHTRIVNLTARVVKPTVYWCSQNYQTRSPSDREFSFTGVGRITKRIVVVTLHVVMLTNSAQLFQPNRFYKISINNSQRNPICRIYKSFYNLANLFTNIITEYINLQVNLDCEIIHKFCKSKFFMCTYIHRKEKY